MNGVFTWNDKLCFPFHKQIFHKYIECVWIYIYIYITITNSEQNLFFHYHTRTIKCNLAKKKLTSPLIYTGMGAFVLKNNSQ